MAISFFDNDTPATKRNPSVCYMVADSKAFHMYDGCMMHFLKPNHVS